MIDVTGMRAAAAKVQMIMPGHGVMLNAASVIALCDAYEAVKKERDQARRYLGYSEGQTLEEAGLADNRRDRIRGITALLNKAREDLSGYLSILRGPSVVENAVTLNVTKLMLDETRVILAEIEVALAKPEKIP